VRLFACEFSNEVAGVVLVDSSYPDQWTKWKDILPPESADEPASLHKMRMVLEGQRDPKSNPEHLDVIVSSAQVKAAGSLGNIPLVVISHSPKWRIDATLPDDVSDKLELTWQKWQEELCHLSTHSAHKVAIKAGHYIQPEEPQLIVD